MTSRRAQRRNRIIIAGDGIVAEAIGHSYDSATASRNDLPAKVDGQHRWIATAAFVLRDIDMAAVDDETMPKFLDHENLFSLAIGCWDCEQPLGTITVGSHCPGDPS